MMEKKKSDVSNGGKAHPPLTTFSPNWSPSTALQQLSERKTLFEQNKSDGWADELPAEGRKEEQRSESTFLQTDSLSFNWQER